MMVYVAWLVHDVIMRWKENVIDQKSPGSLGLYDGIIVGWLINHWAVLW